MQKTVREVARDVPVFRECDVLVVGGGPAGSAAAASAAQAGADTILVERYGHLGGLSTGGLVVWIDRMTDWDGEQVIGGFANDLLDRVPKDALLGPSDDIWGSRDPALVEYWQERSNAFSGVVTWSPTVDPEILKIVSFELLLERGVKLLMHSWACAPVMDGETIRGVIFESKSGRQAVLAKTVIDATGDGDVFALAGAEFDTDIVEKDIHHALTLGFRWGGVDMKRYIDFRKEQREEYNVILDRGREVGVTSRGHIMPRSDQILFLDPKLTGYSALDVEDLTEVEVIGRRRMITMLDFFRQNMPGFEDAWVLDTASQVGTRHSRRLVGTKQLTREDWTTGRRFEDEIAISPSPKVKYPTVSVPLGSLLPQRVDNLLAAGRNLSCDAFSHTFMREVPQCWSLGQAAGVAAAIAAGSGGRPRDVDIEALQVELREQGVPLHDEPLHPVVSEDEPFEYYFEYQDAE
jgi:hypothetical protein